MTTAHPRTATTEPDTRLDLALVRRGLSSSRTRAQALISAGRVTVNGEPAVRAAQLTGDDDEIAAVGEPYVSRAAYKLLGALDDLALDVTGRRALDAGASTGGFTQVLLERGCPEVVAVDVGSDQLDPRVRADPRVRVWERTNLRRLTGEHVAGRRVDLVVADVSFISLTLLIEPLVSVVQPTGDLLVMIKPQFEVGRERLGRGGVVREPALREQAVTGVLTRGAATGWTEQRVVPSRLPGAFGNLEFFAHLRRPAP